MKKKERVELNFYEIDRVARRFGGSYSTHYKEWKFDNQRKKRRFERLIRAGKIDEPFLHQIWYLLFGSVDAGFNLAFSIIFSIFLLLLVPLWFWGLYQGLLWASFVPHIGVGYWAELHVYAAFIWVFATGGFILSRLGIGAIIAMGLLAAVYIFMSPNSLVSAKDVGAGIQVLSK